MKFIKIVALVGGIALFAWILSTANLEAVLQHVEHIGMFGAGVIVLTFAMGFVADVASWLLLFRSIVVSRLWAFRLWLVLMVGEALNVLAPFGSLGGEPFKALLLKRHYGVSYQEGTASLLLIQTVNSLAQVPFIIVGVVLLLQRDLLPPAVQNGIVAGTLLVTFFMVMVLIVLHLRALAALARRLNRSRWGERLARVLAAMREIEEHLFYVVRHTPGRFAAALALAFLNWAFGALEMFLIFYFLGHPISMGEAWMTEATVVLVRSVTFFVPGHIGVQDGAIALVAGQLTGSPEVGLAVALVRRGRELLWSGIGLGIGGWFGFKEPKAA